MNNTRKAALTVGICFILAAVTSIIALALYQPVLTNPDYVIQTGIDDKPIILGALLELVLAATAVGTSIGLFPYLKKHNESIALGYVCFRLFEAVVIVIGLIGLLSLLTLRQAFAADPTLDAASFQTTARLLVAIHDWTFMLGPNFMLGINTLMCSYLLFQTRLVPRIIGVMGMVGAVLIFTASILEMFGVIAQLSTWGAVLALPVFAYEMTLAVRLIVKGFNAPAIASESAKADTNNLLTAPLKQGSF